MRNHKCGTCRFYQEAQLASSGWCHHPQRKTTSDIMIMVRKNELACRDEWAHDLWEPKSAQTGTPTTAPGQFADRKERPATEAEIAAVLAASSGQANLDDAGTDVSDIVLSEFGAGPIPLTYAERVEPLRDWAPASSRSVEPAETPPATADHGSTARGAIIRAREAYRERSRQGAARSQEIAELAQDTLPAAERGSSPPMIDVSVDEPAPAPIIDQPAAVLDQPSAPSFDLPEPSNDESEGIVLASSDDEAPNEAEAEPVAQSVHDALFEHETERPTWTDDVVTATDHEPAVDHDVPLAATNESETSRRQNLDDPFDFGSGFDRDEATTIEPGFNRAGDAPRYPAPEASQPSPAERYPTDRQPYADRPSYWSASGPSTAHFGQPDEPNFDEYRSTENDVAYDNFDLDVIDEITATSRLLDREAEMESEAVSLPDDNYIEDHVVSGNDQRSDVVIPLRPTLSAHLPRVCRTCRDFRPAETSDRGWCANQWAFSHRRVVAADEQAPCDSVLGDWWLPADEVWSDAADVSSHGQPTPLLDAWLPEYQENLPSRRRS